MTSELIELKYLVTALKILLRLAASVSKSILYTLGCPIFIKGSRLYHHPISRSYIFEWLSSPPYSTSSRLVIIFIFSIVVTPIRSILTLLECPYFCKPLYDTPYFLLAYLQAKLIDLKVPIYFSS